MKKRFALAFLIVFALTGTALAADTIKIGVYLPLSGQMAFGGQLELEGVQMANKEAPTVLGKKVELFVVDNKSDKVEAADAVKRLIEKEKVVAIIGTYGSSLAMAGGEVAEKAKIPMVGTSCTNPLVTQGKIHSLPIPTASARATSCAQRRRNLAGPPRSAPVGRHTGNRTGTIRAAW